MEDKTSYYHVTGPSLPASFQVTLSSSWKVTLQSLVAQVNFKQGDIMMTTTAPHLPAQWPPFQTASTIVKVIPKVKLVLMG